MKNVTISAKRYMDQFRFCLEDKLQPLKKLGVNIDVTEEYKGNMTFLGCSFRNTTLANLDYEKMAVSNIAEALASYIVDVLEKPLIDKLIKSTYSETSEKEQNMIYIKTLELIRIRNHQHSRDIRLKKIMAEKLVDYFDKQWQINIEGFVRFRLQEYMTDLTSVMEEAKEEVVVEKEYNDFIKLLRYFVDIQEPKVTYAHLMKKKGKYILIDSNDDIIAEEACGDLNGCDAIISCLVTYAPEKIHVHIKDFYSDEEVLTTVNNIFDDRVVLCLGCNTCAEIKDNKISSLEDTNKS
ncbi:putative sporulation protein YtxC [Alkalicella caledoniensis]|uniref:Putative sporulation protein YtxC n=1 Tax=Alkalicella caledoniensis TaxID=2731377 RepID=A0A7G9WAI5_ALKCA|nr:putative sporulation protein YtxC [Alkalicella caledoniensis]QNO15697.1 putative sporulation protein YtxC [Alkalicella caledoniensis]